jgi:2-oxoglutarate dehydrogenase E1 component
MMYQEIRALPTTRALYAARLEAQNIIQPDEPDEMVRRYRDQLDAGNSVTPAVILDQPLDAKVAANWKSYVGHGWDEPCDTTVALEKLQWLAGRLQQLPTGFELHPRVMKSMDDRRKMASGALAVDWGFAEVLAYASRLPDTHLRTGQ